MHGFPREHMLILRLSTRERANLKTLAARYRMGMSELVRTLVARELEARK